MRYYWYYIILYYVLKDLIIILYIYTSIHIYIILNMSMILPNAHAIPPKPHSHRHDQMTLPQVVGFIATAQKLQGLHRRPAVALGQDVDAPPGVNGTGTFPWIRREVFGQVKPTWEPLKNCGNDQNTRDSYGFITFDAEIYMVI